MPWYRPEQVQGLPVIRTLFLLVAAALMAAGPLVAQVQIAADFDGDGAEDLAELVVNTHLMSADLVIATATQTYRFPQIAYSGAAAGQEASLALSSDGALEIHSGNLSIGRDRWDQTLTIAWQEDAFRVVGIMRSWWDTLTPDSDGNCEIDMLTGRGMANGPVGTYEIRLETPAPPLADWEGVLPEGCHGMGPT